jgi:uncharacterized protein YwqG
MMSSGDVEGSDIDKKHNKIKAINSHSVQERMMSTLSTALPEVLQPYQEKIEHSQKTFVRISARNEQPSSSWSSKFGGLPYFPKDQPYPTTDDGVPLHLLAQLNFAEAPALEQFPQSGILQFYIAHDDLYGLNFDDQRQQNTFRVLYWQDVLQDESKLLTDFSFINDNEEDLAPFTGEYALAFELAQAPVSIGDATFSSYLHREAYTGADDSEAFYEAYSELFAATGHKIGGYPFFTQSDPREYDDAMKEYILLFQMDTDDANGLDIMWGDCGVANFFIHPDDLKNKDFSKVLYNWDCC